MCCKYLEKCMILAAVGIVHIFPSAMAGTGCDFNSENPAQVVDQYIADVKADNPKILRHFSSKFINSHLEEVKKADSKDKEKRIKLSFMRYLEFGKMLKDEETVEEKCLSENHAIVSIRGVNIETRKINIIEVNLLKENGIWKIHEPSSFF